jgi:hypothetical protein
MPSYNKDSFLFLEATSKYAKLGYLMVRKEDWGMGEGRPLLVFSIEKKMCQPRYDVGWNSCGLLKKLNLIRKSPDLIKSWRQRIPL